MFLRNGLMQFGSIFGHGAYLGPDFTADYLHRAALDVEAAYGGEGTDARRRTIEDFRTNTYDSGDGNGRVLRRPGRRLRAVWWPHYHDFFADPAGDTGLRPAAITDPEDTRQLTAYFSWSAWVAAAERPGKDYSYTNNWPPEELVDNGPTADVRGVERAVAHRPAGRDRGPAGGVRTVELARLARPGPAGAVVPGP